MLLVLLVLARAVPGSKGLIYTYIYNQRIIDKGASFLLYESPPPSTCPPTPAFSALRWPLALSAPRPCSLPHLNTSLPLPLPNLNLNFKPLRPTLTLNLSHFAGQRIRIRTNVNQESPDHHGLSVSLFFLWVDSGLTSGYYFPPKFLSCSEL